MRFTLKSTRPMEELDKTKQNSDYVTSACVHRSHDSIFFTVVVYNGRHLHQKIH